MSADETSNRRRLIHSVRINLVPVLSQGGWSQIEADHKSVGLPWREDLKPGWGKPKYVAQVLEDLVDDDVVSVARRALAAFPERGLIPLEDALLWLDANGVQQITAVTRLALAKVFDGQRLHPNEAPDNVLARFAQAQRAHKFLYLDDATLVAEEIDMFSLVLPGRTSTPPERLVTSHAALLETYAFNTWADARVFQLLEYLTHPTVRTGEEQVSLVAALNAVLAADRVELVAGEQVSGHPLFKVRPLQHGVAGRPKNLIFASTGPKPDLAFADAVNNDIVILKNEEYCLVYDEPIDETGLPWIKLVQWFARRYALDATADTTRRALGERLSKALASEVEGRVFSAYFKGFRSQLGDALPALLPQVYLHYDPLTLRELRARGEAQRFDVQRMDFLLLLPHGVRVVLEVDGQQHYSTGIEATAKPSPEVYARTVRSDRHLRLAGYDVFRFGGYELQDEATSARVLEDFFTRLFRKYKLIPSNPSSK